MNVRTAVRPREDARLSEAIPDKHGGSVAGRMDVRLWLRLLSCSMVIEKRLRRRFADRFDTTLPRFDVLAALDRHPDGMTMGELSRALLVSNGNVTALVRQLHSRDLVTIETVPGDRRSQVVRLTPAGVAHFADLAAAHHAWVGTMLADVPADQQAQLFALLGAVKASIARAGGDEE
jgi:DNA-binding MarR family transcriptional regulator